jgi:hypothetical protein
MIVNFVREFYAKCNRTVVHTSSMPLLLSTSQRQNVTNRCNDPLDVRDCSRFPLQLRSGRTADRYICVPLRVPGLSRQNRWVTKTDSAPVPLDKSAIQAVTPSQIYQWEGLGPDVELTGTSEERLPAEQTWYALTGRVVDAKVEADGDIQHCTSRCQR